MNMFNIYINLQKLDIRNWYIWIPSKGVYSIVNILRLLYKIWDPILHKEYFEDPYYPPQNQALEKIHEDSFEEGPIYEITHSPIILSHPKNLNYLVHIVDILMRNILYSNPCLTMRWKVHAFIHFMKSWMLFLK